MYSDASKQRRTSGQALSGQADRLARLGRIVLRAERLRDASYPEGEESDSSRGKKARCKQTVRAVRPPRSAATPQNA